MRSKILKFYCHDSYYSTECNGQLPLNNQRTLSPQNSIKRPPTPSPRNSFKSRNNSVSSTRSYCNAIDLHRQSSFNSHRTVNSLTSGGSGKDDYKQNNLSDLQTEIRIPCDKLEDDKAQEDEDPDAMDETVSSYLLFLHLNQVNEFNT